jgi:hypothetical protein
LGVAPHTALPTVSGELTLLQEETPIWNAKISRVKSNGNWLEEHGLSTVIIEWPATLDRVLVAGNEYVLAADIQSPEAKIASIWLSWVEDKGMFKLVAPKVKIMDIDTRQQ